MNCAVHTNSQAVAYCRTCGKALCEDCKRDVMGAIYCEPCIAARLQGSAGQGVSAAPRPITRVPGAPNPAVAGFFGLIPGVGAMYNGQFTKAFAHVVIFVLLIMGASEVHWTFGVMIGFFVLYMAFEAYKTAEAKRMGIPAPDPFGLDKMLGLQETHVHIANPATQPTTAAYSPSATAYPPVQAVQIEPPPPPKDHTPIGAIVLIVLGVLFLLNNLNIMHVRHLGPLFLIGIGLWLAYKRTARPSAGGTQ